MRSVDYWTCIYNEEHKTPLHLNQLSYFILCCIIPSVFYNFLSIMTKTSLILPFLSQTSIVICMVRSIRIRMMNFFLHFLWIVKQWYNLFTLEPKLEFALFTVLDRKLFTVATLDLGINIKLYDKRSHGQHGYKASQN